MATGVLHSKPVELVVEGGRVVVVVVAVDVALVVELVGLADVVVELAEVVVDVGGVEVDGGGFLAATLVVGVAFASADSAVPAPRPTMTPQVSTTAQRRRTPTVRVLSMASRPFGEPSPPRRDIDDQR
jgi:hypothetical protein